LALGLLAGVMNARATGRGQVVDAAIVDGSASMMNLLMGLKSAGLFANERGRSVLGGPHWYRTYRCADGRFVTVGALEPKFYRLLMDKLGLADDPAYAKPRDPAAWPQLHERFVELFASRTCEEWCALLEGTDACFAPVLDPDEAAAHPHMAQREAYARIDGVLQANPAPRFSCTPAQAGRVPRRGEHQQAVLEDWGRTR
jgi:acetyl-CoA hydrolase